MFKNKLVLYIFLVLLIFGGMTLANIIAAVIYGLGEGTIIARIADIPFVLFLVLSIVISAVLFFLIFRKRK